MGDWIDSSIPQKVYVGKMVYNSGTYTVVNLNAPTNTTYKGYIISTSYEYDNEPGIFPNDYINPSLIYDDITIDPTTRLVSSSSSRSLGEELWFLMTQNATFPLYIMLVPIIPVYIPYFSNDVTLSTLLDTSSIHDSNGGYVGPNRVFLLDPPVSGHQYIYENGLDPGLGGEIVVNSMNTTEPLVGYPLIKDEKSNGFFNIYKTDNRYSVTYNILYIYGETLDVLLLGTFSVNSNYNSLSGVYGAIHNPNNDSLYIPISAMINFWDISEADGQISVGIHLLDIGSNFRSNIENHNTNQVIQTSIQILGTSDIPAELRIQGVSYILPRGGTWGIDVDGYGNIYATLGDGFVIKVKKDYSSYSVVCNGLLEPWNVCVIDKKSLTPTLLVANTRYGTIVLVNPDGSVQTICGTPVMPYQEGFGKTIHDTSEIYPHGVFGCPTSVTIAPDFSILVGDETGQAIRKIASPTLANKIQQLQSNLPVVHNEHSYIIVILIIILIFILLV